ESLNRVRQLQFSVPSWPDVRERGEDVLREDVDRHDRVIAPRSLRLLDRGRDPEDAWLQCIALDHAIGAGMGHVPQEDRGRPMVFPVRPGESRQIIVSVGEDERVRRLHKEWSPSWAMIGSISFGISLEKGRSRVPIPPAVINAGYDSRLAGSSASTELVALRFDNMCRPHTPLFLALSLGSGLTSTPRFQHG